MLEKEIQKDTEVKEINDDALVLKIEKKCKRKGCRQSAKYILFFNKSGKIVHLCLEHLNEAKSLIKQEPVQAKSKYNTKRTAPVKHRLTSIIDRIKEEKKNEFTK